MHFFPTKIKEKGGGNGKTDKTKMQNQNNAQLQERKLWMIAVLVS
jgi:hypothetical protein